MFAVALVADSVTVNVTYGLYELTTPLPTVNVVDISISYVYVVKIVEAAAVGRS